MPGRRKAVDVAPARPAKQREAGGKFSSGQAAPIRSRKGETVSPTRTKRGSSAQGGELTASLPLLRNSERSAMKRCEFAWWLTYGQKRKPITEMPALRFGSLIHGALAAWYIPGVKRGENPVIAFERLYEADLKENNELFGMRLEEDDKWHDAAELGDAMLSNYLDEYGEDEHWEVLVTEWAFRYLVYKPWTYDPNHPPEAQAGAEPWFYATGVVDGVWRDRRDKSMWVPDHKTAAALGRNDTKLRYLQVDDQAGMYWSYGLKAIVAAGMMPDGKRLSGMLYNFLRKALPDERPSRVEKGKRIYLNKDGSPSKQQPAPYFRRIPIFRDEHDRAEAMRRIEVDFKRIEMLRSGELEVSKTPGQFTCPMCSVRDACELHEVGQDWNGFLKSTTQEWDPYEQHAIYEGR